MIDFLLTLLAGIGLSHILVDGSIMLGIKKKLVEWDAIEDTDGKVLLDERDEPIMKDEKDQKWAWLRTLLACYQCSGWHAGLITSSILFLSMLPYMGWLKVFLYAFAASLLSTAWAVMLIYFNSPTQVIDHENGTSGNQTEPAN